MRKLLILSLLFVFAMPIWADTKLPIKIVNITDGDTIKAKIDKNEFSVRLVDIDC